jgi:hypothetical protein
MGTPIDFIEESPFSEICAARTPALRCQEGPLMSRAKAKFTESDMRRVLSAAAKAGVSVRVEIATDGKIVVTSDGQNVAQKPNETANTDNPWNEVLKGAAPEQKRAS